MVHWCLLLLLPLLAASQLSQWREPNGTLRVPLANSSTFTAPPLAPPPLKPTKCADACHTNGGTCNEQLGRCDCHRLRDGPSCEVVLEESALARRCAYLKYENLEDCLAGWGSQCINQCNGRGTCVTGICHCAPGHFGTDCSLSLDSKGKPQILRGTGYTTRAKRPWIYIYDLPAEHNTWINIKRIDRPTFFYFWQRLLGSGAVTADPKQADFFFIPIHLRQIPEPTQDLPRSLRYIDKTWPHFMTERTGSHFVMHTGDWGKWELGGSKADKLLYQKLTWLTHWGIYDNSRHPNWAVSHNPKQDVVIPVITPLTRAPVFGHDKSPLHPRASEQPVRDKIFFHAGRICGGFLEKKPPDTTQPWPNNCRDATRYSGGVRQRIHSLYHDRPGWVILGGTPQFQEALRTSKFCLATQGAGHGNRQAVGSLAGCLPDGIYQLFEPEMSYDHSGIRIKEDDIPKLHEKLESIGEEELKKRQAALRCTAQHLHWSSLVGGILQESGAYDAFETTLEVMRMHAQHPNTPPEKLYEVDQDFRKFMSCGAAFWGGPPIAHKNTTVCSMSKYDGPSKSCQKCLPRDGIGNIGPPGGSMCCGYAADLSKCPRPWD